MKQVVSYGAGTNSTAMVIEMVNRREQIDAIVFADTGGERPETYAYIAVFNLWLSIKGYPQITVVKADNIHGTLEQECLDRETLPAVAFGWKTCSDKWKIAPFKKWLKAQEWDDVTVCIGFDADEPHRAKRGDLSTAEKYKKRYPLIEFNMGREECVQSIAAASLPRAGKSSCFFCPNSKMHEILSLPADLKERAIAIESNAHKAHSVKGLGRSFSWRNVIEGDAAQMKMFEPEIALPCGCYDGD